ncbi:hypothetical protein SKAU_G00206200 [Synaphobranchus kaupii]|uniref:Uncharacterized protein n=1 Tax=Synaphobranchus kaupii TaxID=118154 RepID=A0A9Q1FGE0_SYNKA|nr:hypothetical protein SKAU_G00206200 [Synaphobranchus kaupii]
MHPFLVGETLSRERWCKHFPSVRVRLPEDMMALLPKLRLWNTKAVVLSYGFANTSKAASGPLPAAARAHRKQQGVTNGRSPCTFQISTFRSVSVL